MQTARAGRLRRGRPSQRRLGLAHLVGVVALVGAAAAVYGKAVRRGSAMDPVGKVVEEHVPLPRRDGSHADAPRVPRGVDIPPAHRAPRAGRVGGEAVVVPAAAAPLPAAASRLPLSNPLYRILNDQIRILWVY